MFSKTHSVQKNQQQDQQMNQNQLVRKSRPRNSKGKPRGFKCGGKNGTDYPTSTNVVLPKQPYEEKQRKDQFFEDKFEELGIEDKKDQIDYRKNFEFLEQFSDKAKDEFCTNYIGRLQDKGYENCFVDTELVHEINLPGCKHSILAVPIWCEIPMTIVKKMLPEAAKKVKESPIPIIQPIIAQIRNEKKEEEDSEDNDSNNDNDDDFILSNEIINSSDISSSDEDSDSEKPEKRKSTRRMLPKRHYRKNEFDDSDDDTDDDTDDVVQEIRLDQRMEHF